MKKLAPPITFLLCVALMSLLRWRWPGTLITSFPLNLLGLLPILLGLGTLTAGALTFLKARTTLRPFSEAAHLVTTGPYLFTRNPMYLGLAVTLTGVWVLLGALSCLLVVPLYILVADRWFIAYEEQMLHRKFGPAFDAYKSHVRRWL